jgi:hypothetical protein
MSEYTTLQDMEHLNAFIKTQPDQTDGHWAGRLGISRSHFNMIRNGTAVPGRKLMIKIADLTQGAVPVTAWFDQVSA